MSAPGSFCPQCYGVGKVFTHANLGRGTETVWIACPDCQPGPHPRRVEPALPRNDQS